MEQERKSEKISESEFDKILEDDGQHMWLDYVPLKDYNEEASFDS